MAILIILTGCRCGCLGQSESASHSAAAVTAWARGLANPLLVIYVHKRVLKILVMKTLDQKYFIKNFIWNENKALQRPDESLVGLDK